MESSSLHQLHRKTFTATLDAEDDDWDSLVALTAEGDQSAFSMLYDRSSPRVYGLVLRILRDQDTAEEVTLDVFTQVWRTALHFDRRRGSACAWLLTIARSRAIDRLRAEQVERGCQDQLDSLEGLTDEGQDPETITVQSERERLVREALARLSDAQRESLLLAYFSGLSHFEIAARLGLPPGTVKTRIRLGMQKLREWLAPLSSDA
jgi:RNA polymerase sigma-70 factor (ECF subfamily)